MLSILRPIHMVLIALLVVLQAQLWFGRGSLPDVMRLQQQLKEQKQNNQAAQLANERLGAELHDLKDGLEMVEERARAEIGMVKPNEIFVQIAPYNIIPCTCATDSCRPRLTVSIYESRHTRRTRYGKN